VGAGSIGSAVIRRLRGFGCRILVHTVGRPPAGAESVSLDALLRASDVVTLHVPLDATTHHLVGAAEIAAMKSDAVLVNTSRGAVVDTAALTGALEAGHLGGAALDVIEGEDGCFARVRGSRDVDHPFLPRLLAMPNVVVTPHTAFRTRRALREIVKGTLANCAAFERGRVHA
jgi:D-specific alpha-keto acid dehydrogenase